MSKNAKRLRQLKQRYLTINLGISTILIIVIFTALSYMSIQKRGQIIAKMLDEQKTIAKNMTDEVDKIYLILNAIEFNEQHIENVVLKSKLEESKRKLRRYVNTYNKRMNDISSGNIDYDNTQVTLWDRNKVELGKYIDYNVNIWNELKEYYMGIYEGSLSTDEFVEYYNRINTSSYRLIEISGLLANNYQESNNKLFASANNVIALVVGFLGIVIILGIYQIYKYLFVPLGELYNAFGELGFENVAEKKGTGIEEIANDMKGMFQGVVKTLELSIQTSATTDMNEFLQRIYNSFAEHLPYSYIGMALLNDKDGVHGGYISATYGVGEEESINKEMTDILNYEVPIDSTSIADIIYSGEPQIVNDLESYILGRPMKGYNRVLLEAGMNAAIIVPLVDNESTQGIIYFLSNKKDVYKENHRRFLRVLSASISLAFQKNIYIEELLYSTLLALTKISEEKDKDTGEHLIRMKEYSVKLANLMCKDIRFKKQIDSKFIRDIEKFSPMHDIGKVGVPDKILLKPGKLTPEEFNIIKTHTTNGARVLQEAQNHIVNNKNRIFKMGIDIAQTHHEKWDGTGYPKGLKGIEIPLSGRITALADVLDALLSKRLYKDAFSFNKAQQIIIEGKGSHFDPDIVDVFLENIHEFQGIYQKNMQKEGA